MRSLARRHGIASVELHEKATTCVAGDFLRTLIQAVPYRIHMVLTDNGIHFTTPGNLPWSSPARRNMSTIA